MYPRAWQTEQMHASGSPTILNSYCFFLQTHAGAGWGANRKRCRCWRAERAVGAVSAESLSARARERRVKREQAALGDTALSYARTRHGPVVGGGVFGADGTRTRADRRLVAEGDENQAESNTVRSESDAK